MMLAVVKKTGVGVGEESPRRGWLVLAVLVLVLATSKIAVE